MQTIIILLSILGNSNEEQEFSKIDTNQLGKKDFKNLTEGVESSSDSGAILCTCARRVPIRLMSASMTATMKRGLTIVQPVENRSLRMR